MDTKELEKKFADIILDNTKEQDEKIEALKLLVEGGADAQTVKLMETEIATGKENLTKMQTQVDEMATAIKKGVHEPDNVDPLKKMISDNIEEIQKVHKGHAFQLETKTVGNMVLANLTGDQERTYSPGAVILPGQRVNVADLLGAPVMLSNGTWTFLRETTSEGSISAQTEGSDKSQIDYDLAMIDVNTDFIAGFAVYSKKMANNIPYLETFLPQALRRDYWIAENDIFEAVLAAGVTASSQIITDKNKVEMLINELAALEAINFMPNFIVLSPADFYNILVTEKSTGAGYGLPGVVTFEGGVLRINGVQVVRVNWMEANKYYVGDFTGIRKAITQGLSLEFSESDEDNFRKNNITARIEAQVAIGIERVTAVNFGDFTAT